MSGIVSAATAFGDVNLIRMGSERVEPVQTVDEHVTGWPGRVGAARTQRRDARHSMTPAGVRAVPLMVAPPTRPV